VGPGHDHTVRRTAGRRPNRAAAEDRGVGERRRGHMAVRDDCARIGRLAPFQRIGAHQMLFAAYVLGPSVVLYLLPLAFYRIPLIVNLSGAREVLVDGSGVARAVAVSLTWFLVAVGIVVWPARRVAGPRPWSPPALWGAFVVFSLVGGAVSLFHTLFAAPAGAEEVVHQLAFAPVIGCVLGVQILRGLDRGAGSLRRAAAWAMLLLDLAVALAVPLLLAKAAPMAFGLLAVLYGLNATGVPRRWVVPVVALSLAVIAVSLPLREYLRGDLLAQPAFQRVLPRTHGALLRSRAPDAVKLPDSFDVERIVVFEPWRIGFRFHRVEGPLLYVEFVVARAVNRINRLADLAYVVKTTPGSVPYARGATYVPLAGALVPRILWKHKPADQAGQFYGHRYQFLDPSDTVHSDNLPLVTEGWMNWGWAGVLASAVLFGTVLRVVYTGWVGESTAPGNVMIAMAVIGTAVDGDSNLSLIVGGMVHALLIYWAIDVLIRALSRRRAGFTSGSG